MSMRTHRTVIVAALLAFVVVGCATNPVTGRREFVMMSESQEIAMGQRADAQVREQMGLYDDSELQAYVSDIGHEMAALSHRPDLPWSFAVVDSPVVNAFAIPGGYIYLTRGIMAYLGDEADLAGVLGHEIGHVTARHSVQAYTRASGAQLGLVAGSVFSPAARALGGLAESGLGLLFLRYGRDAELQSDRLGAEYAVQSGWDPTGVRDMLSTLGRLQGDGGSGIPSWLFTHPEPNIRVGRIDPVLEELSQQASLENLRVNRIGYLDRLDGMLYGDNPDQGIVRGSEFLHPVLRFTFRFPEGWDVTNMPTQVVAQQPGEEVYMVLQPVENADSGSLEQLARGNMRESGFSAESGGDTWINGLNAYIGTFAGERQDGSLARARVAYIRHDGAIYLVGGLTDSSAYGRSEVAFNDAIRSFRVMNASEAESIRSNRLRFYAVRQGDTWQSIAQGAGQDILPPETLAVMNGFPVNEQPRSGDRVKVVQAG